MLPSHSSLPIHLLAASFNHTSATYKFYWFLALLDEIEKGNTRIPKQHLFAQMIAHSWYTVNYFHISFGVQDKLERAIQNIKVLEGLAIDEKKSQIANTLIKSTQPATVQYLRYFDGEVPYRFLSPWYPSLKGNKKEIYLASQQYINTSLYAVNEKEVIINPQWLPYLQEHTGILKSFCYWHLSLYMQKHNPNVPDIPNKLIKPAKRNTLLKQRKEFWDVVIDRAGEVNCIYTHKTLQVGTYAVEHFLPFAFVSHDLVWNLIPADPVFNSSKSDKLPSIDLHFDAFYQLQKTALFTLLDHKPDSHFLQDYLTFLPDLQIVKQMEDGLLKEKFRNNIQPLVTIAANNGFEYLRM